MTTLIKMGKWTFYGGLGGGELYPRKRRREGYYSKISFYTQDIYHLLGR